MSSLLCRVLLSPCQRTAHSAVRRVALPRQAPPARSTRQLPVASRCSAAAAGIAAKMPSAESKQSGLLPVVAPERYDEQLAGKVAEVKAKLERFNMPPPEVHPSGNTLPAGFQYRYLEMTLSRSQSQAEGPATALRGWVGVS